MVSLLKIKNMVCRHCIEALLDICKVLELEVKSIKLGELEVVASPDQIDYPRLKKMLKENGFELLEHKDHQLIERIKQKVIQMVRGEEEIRLKNSAFLESELNLPYTQMSRTFSKHEHLTIERYIILQKIERVKELISYDEKTLSEIAFQLGYSSLQHLSNQFKSITGMSVSQFKKVDDKFRKGINEV